MTVKNNKRKQPKSRRASQKRRGSAKRIVIAASGLALGLAVAITVGAQQFGGRANQQSTQWRSAAANQTDTNQSRTQSHASSLNQGGSFSPNTQQNGRGQFVPSVPSSASFVDPRSTAAQSNVGTYQPARSQNAPRVASNPNFNQTARRFELKHVNMTQFEEGLLKTWGPKINPQVIDHGRKVRVVLPTRSRQHAEMIIDRQNRILDFFGPDSLVNAWRTAMSTLDVSPNVVNGHRSLVEMGRAKPETINKAVTMLTSYQDDGKSNETIQKSVPFGNQDGAPKIVGITNPQGNQDDRPDAQLDRQATVEFIPGFNMIVVRANTQEDLNKIIQVINQLAKSAQETQPEIQVFKLNYSNSQSLRETLQELYDQVYAPRSGDASITAMSSPNAILAIGQKSAIDAIDKLIKRLDVVSPDPGADFKTYRLRFMSSKDAKDRIDAYFGALQTQTVAGGTQNPQQPNIAPVLVVSDYRSNTILVKASQREIVLVDEIVKALDVDGGKDGSGAAHVVEIIPLRNTVASDIAITIQDAINGQLQGAGQGNVQSTNPFAAFGGQNQFQNANAQNQASQIPARSLSLMTVDQEGKTVRSGLMFDVRVSADSNSNSLIVTGPEESMQLIKVLVQKLDRLPDAETQLKVFTIVNGQAEIMLQALQSMFSGGQQNNQFGGIFGGLGGFGQNNTLAQLPIQSGNATEGVTLVNMRFAVDTRTNSIIVSGPISDLKIVENLIMRLDEEDFRTRRVSVYRLNNLGAEDMSTAINAWLDSRRNLNNLDPGLGSAYEQADREIIVIPEAVSNSLIISATPKYYPQIEGIIRALDRRPPMVKVKVTIAEVQLSALKEIGFEYGVQDSLVFDRGIGAVGFPFNQGIIGNNSDALALGTRENLAGQGLLNLSVGRTNNDLGYGGLVLSAGNESISVLMRMLKDRQAVRILSSPHITTVDNLTASVLVGAKIPRIQSSFSNTNGFGGITNQVADVDVGVILQVTPRVNPDGTVILQVDVVNSSIGSEAQGTAIQVSDNGDVIRQAPINSQQAQTTILANSGQTVMFGGLITETKTQAQRGIPFFSDIPTIGQLFRFDSDAKDRRELLIIMTPYIIENPDEVSMHNQVEMDRMHWCEADVVDLHGSLGSSDEFINFDHSRPQVVFPDRQPTVDQMEMQNDNAPPQGNHQPNPTQFDNRQPERSPVVYPAASRSQRSRFGRDSSTPIGTSLPSNFPERRNSTQPDQFDRGENQTRQNWDR